MTPILMHSAPPHTATTNPPPPITGLPSESVTAVTQSRQHGRLLLYISCLFLELQFPHSPRQSQHGIDRVFETGERLLNKSFGYIGREIASYTK